MPQRASPFDDTTRRLLLPAWTFSLTFHFAIILVLGWAIQSIPPGASELPSGSAGIVLNTGSAEGDVFEEEEAAHFVASAAAEQSQPANLLSVLPYEPATSVAGKSAHIKPPTVMRPTTVASGASSQGQAAKPARGTRGSLGGHGYAKVTVFGVQGEGNKFVYLFDRSASMQGAPLAAAKRQLIESLASLESVHQFHVIFFNTKPLAFDITAGGNRIAFATDRNKQLAARFAASITADGGTDRLMALKQAIALAPDVVFFLTDADDPMSPSELAGIARDNSRAQAAICVIEFGRRQSPSPRNFLAELAQQSGGQYGYVNTATFTLPAQ